MTKLSSNHHSPLGLPTGQVINPGATINVDNWNVLSGHPVVKAWISAKVIAADEADDEKLNEGGKGNEPSPELVDLRSQYKELFEKKPFHDWDEATLRKKIDEKLNEGG